MCGLEGSLEGRRVYPGDQVGGTQCEQRWGRTGACTAGTCHHLFMEHLLLARACVKGWGRGRHPAPPLLEASTVTGDDRCDECRNGPRTTYPDAGHLPGQEGPGFPEP